MKVVKKAYRVWVHSHIGEYPVFRIEDVDVVFADNVSDAKNQCDLYDAKNEDGDDARWIDIKCRRAKEDDKVEYEGRITDRGYAEQDKKDKIIKEKRKARLEKLPENDMYYVQDARDYVGNCVKFWGLNNNGYVCDISLAQKYTKEEIIKQFSNSKETDVVWSAKHVEANVSKFVDMQNLRRVNSY